MTSGSHRDNASLEAHSKVQRAVPTTQTGSMGTSLGTSSAGTSMPSASVALSVTRPKHSNLQKQADKRLQSALDRMNSCKQLFLGDFEVLNFMMRREGGQGVVQFMKRSCDGVDFAVKFFHDVNGATSCADLQVISWLWSLLDCGAPPACQFGRRDIPTHTSNLQAQDCRA